MTRVAVVGASGFVGSGVLAQVPDVAVSIRAPRVPTTARTVRGLEEAATHASRVVEELALELSGVNTVVVACGLPDATGNGSDEMFGANSLAPLIVLRAAKKAGCGRVVHVSSAVVQGSASQLDSHPAVSWFSAYSCSKVLAEWVLTREAAAEGNYVELVMYRPPSVHAADRRISQVLTRVARSPLSSVAGHGSAPTPQALHENVCSAVGFLTTCDTPPLIVHHPSEGLTVRSLMTMLGGGRHPVAIPRGLARVIDAMVRLACSLSPRLRPHGRRLQMLWFGQSQARSWLEQAGWVARGDESSWRNMAAEIANEPLGPSLPRRIVLGVTVPMSMNLMRGFPEHLVREGWDVHFVSSGPSLGKTSGFVHHVIPMRRDPHLWHDVSAFLQWLRLLRRIRPDVVAVGTPKAALLGSLAAWVVGVPVRVYKLRGLRLETSTGWRRTMYRTMERLTMRASNGVIAVSPSLRQRSLDLKLCDAGKLRVLGVGSSNGIDLRRMDGAADLEGPRIASSVPVIGFVGRLTQDKGVLDLLAAAELLSQREVQFQLSIIGGIESPAMERAVFEAIDRGIPATYAGYMEDPAAAYATFDLLCLPTYREGFPTVVLEAGAAKLPTVTTRATGAIDSVVDGVTGYLVDVGSPIQIADALQRLLENAELRQSMGLEARTRVEKYFNQRDVWASEIDVYNSLFRGVPLHPNAAGHP